MKKIVFLVMILFCGLTLESRAQSKLSDLLNKNTLGDVVGNILSKSSLATADLTGTWTYAGSACVFESDDLLKKAGGAVAASKMNERLEKVYGRIGVKEGAFDFTFNADSTFTSKLGRRTLQGTYSLGDGTITLQYEGLVKNKTVTAHTQKTGDKLSLLFDADKLLKMFSNLCSITQSKTLDAVAKLAEGYDGMLIGYELTR